MAALAELHSAAASQIPAHRSSLIFPIAAVSVADPGEILDQLDARDVFGIL
jgi:hypothetical protein